MTVIIRTPDPVAARTIVNRLLPQWAFTMESVLGDELFIFRIPHSLDYEVKGIVCPDLDVTITEEPPV